MDIIRLEHVQGLIEFLDWENRKQFSLYLCQLVVKNDLSVSVSTEVPMVLNLLTPLLIDYPSKAPEDYHHMIPNVSYEQDLLLRALWSFSNESQNEEFEVCKI
jgi:hypothetical protein